MQGDAAGLKTEVDRILRKLEISASAAEASVSLLRQIDTAKSRMEEACSLLKASHSPISALPHLVKQTHCSIWCWTNPNLRARVLMHNII